MGRRVDVGGGVREAVSVGLGATVRVMVTVGGGTLVVVDVAVSVGRRVAVDVSGTPCTTNRDTDFQSSPTKIWTS